MEPGCPVCVCVAGGGGDLLGPAHCSVHTGQAGCPGRLGSHNWGRFWMLATAHSAQEMWAVLSLQGGRHF